ncbi:hypothetical protein INR49_030637 [Caranx melampygus]|nr:hypothetical protein INR49_030637 [Caranx melampygus]
MDKPREFHQGLIEFLGKLKRSRCWRTTELSWGRGPSVSLFRDYLRLKTVHPEPDYVCPGRVVSIMTWEGTNPRLKSILLNSHTDVVPVFQNIGNTMLSVLSKMQRATFLPGNTGHEMCNYTVVHPGSQRLKAEGRKLMRTVHLMFVPDEEVGGHKGMETFVKHPEFQKLNIGFALDEGLANPGEAFTVFYGERTPGVGSLSTAQEVQAMGLAPNHNSFLDFREKERHRLNTTECFTLGDVTTVNMTMVKGGVAYNVIPS